jgi:hypothetical protein
MASRTLQLGLASVFASLLLVCASGETIASSREGIQGAGLTMADTARTDPLVCDESMACFDIATGGPDITHILIDSGCEASPSDYEIAVDGERVGKLHTNDGPCPEFPRDIWFLLKDKQDTALVCVSVRMAGPEGIQVYAKAGNECIIGVMP